MTITQNLIDHLANLAKLQLTAEEKERYLKDLSSILAYVETIQKLTVKQELKLTEEKTVNNWRQDMVSNCGEQIKERIRESFPDKKDNLLKVKGVFE